MRVPAGLRQQPGHQCTAQEEPVHLAAKLCEIGLGAVGLQQHAKRFAVVVVIGAEVVEADHLGGRGVQIIDGAYIGAWHQLWYSPQLTSRTWPLIPLARSLARNRTAEATSSSVGSRLRSELAAVAA